MLRSTLVLIVAGVLFPTSGAFGAPPILASADGSFLDGSLSPVAVPGLPPVRAVRGTDEAAAAVAVDGTVWSWGNGARGRVGDGTWATSAYVPRQAVGLSDVKAISVDERRTLALKRDGTVWAWGRAYLGNGTRQSSNVPVRVQGLSHITALGENAGNYALRADGTVWAWGDNFDGQLGDGSTRRASLVPVRVKRLTYIKAVYSSLGSAYALRRDGTVWSWGAVSNGRLGTGAHSNKAHAAVRIPARLTKLSGVRSLTTSPSATYALLSNGQVRAWGEGTLGELGNGKYPDSALTPVRVKGQRGVSSLSIINATAYAVHRDGSVWAWGPDQYTSAGTVGRRRATPHRIAGVRHATRVVAGDGGSVWARWAYAVLSDGTVRAWGNGLNGQLGDGRSHNTRTPVVVRGLNRVRSVMQPDLGGAGNLHAYAITADGVLWHWGGLGGG